MRERTDEMAISDMIWEGSPVNTVSCPVITNEPVTIIKPLVDSPEAHASNLMVSEGGQVHGRP